MKRKTSTKKFKAKIMGFKAWIKENRHMHITELFKLVRLKLIGHYRYYGIADNGVMLGKYKFEVVKLIFKCLNRRSQKKSFDYDKFNKYLKISPLPEPKIYVNIYR